MALTRNGFEVLKPTSTDLVTFKLEGVPFKVWVEAGPAFKWLATFLHAVEPVSETGWDGGYAYRAVAGSTIWSEHSAGVAIDWNASQHLRTGKRYEGWGKTQVDVIRWMLTRTLKGSFFEWGADWKNPDPMHFELKSAEKWNSPDNPWRK